MCILSTVCVSRNICKEDFILTSSTLLVASHTSRNVSLHHTPLEMYLSSFMGVVSGMNSKYLKMASTFHSIPSLTHTGHHTHPQLTEVRIKVKDVAVSLDTLTSMNSCSCPRGIVLLHWRLSATVVSCVPLE